MPRVRLLIVCLVVAAVLAAVLVRVAVRGTSAGPGEASPAGPAAAPASGPVPNGPARTGSGRALSVLHAWDGRRAAAYAAGRPAALRALYTDGSTAGVADVRLLRGYGSRGYRVTSMTTQVLALDVLAASRDRLRVRVVDRLSGAVAVRPGDRRTLPRDRASTRVVTLVRDPDRGWRVSAVR